VSPHPRSGEFRQPVIRPAAAACSCGAGVTAGVTGQAAVRIVDSYPPDCAGFCPRWRHPVRPSRRSGRRVT